MKILVTGNAGFIGFHVCKKLLERGDAVVGLDNMNKYYDIDLKKSRLKILKGVFFLLKNGILSAASNVKLTTSSI